MDTLLPIQDRGGPAQPLLLATGLRKHFPVAGGLLGRTTKVVRAVDDLTLSVAKGETLGVVGESGCGKSTVARLLIRLITPDRGTMVLDGDPVDEPHGITVNELRRQVQMVFQDSYASLNPRLTIAETLAFSGKAVADVDAFVFHQSNRFIMKHLMKKSGLPDDRVPMSIEDSGNCGGPSVAVAMTRRLTPPAAGQQLHWMLLGYGVGLSWGAAMIQIDDRTVLLHDDGEGLSLN